MKLRSKASHAHAAPGDYYVVAEPKSPWRFFVYAFHFHKPKNVDHEQYALELVRDVVPAERYNVRGWRGDDDFELLASSVWPFRRVRWFCFEPVVDPA